MWNISDLLRTSSCTAISVTCSKYLGNARSEVQDLRFSPDWSIRPVATACKLPWFSTVRAMNTDPKSWNSRQNCTFQYSSFFSWWEFLDIFHLGSGKPGEPPYTTPSPSALRLSRMRKPKHHSVAGLLEKSCASVAKLSSRAREPNISTTKVALLQQGCCANVAKLPCVQRLLADLRTSPKNIFLKLRTLNVCFRSNSDTNWILKNLTRTGVHSSGLVFFPPIPCIPRLLESWHPRRSSRWQKSGV